MRLLLVNVKIAQERHIHKKKKEKINFEDEVESKVFEQDGSHET